MSDLLSHDVLVISQKAKVIEMTNEYRVLDDAGTEVGTIREVEQSKTRKAVRLFSGVDQFLTHKLGVFDRDGQQVVDRPPVAVVALAGMGHAHRRILGTAELAHVQCPGKQLELARVGSSPSGAARFPKASVLTKLVSSSMKRSALK